MLFDIKVNLTKFKLLINSEICVKLSRLKSWKMYCEIITHFLKSQVQDIVSHICFSRKCIPKQALRVTVTS